MNDIWSWYFPVPQSKNAEHPIAREIVGIPTPSSLHPDTVAADHLERISDELREINWEDYE